MDHLLRANAPITDDAWKALDDEAADRLAPVLGARKIVDFRGPHGWEYSATNLGRVGARVDSDGVVARPRLVLPVIEVRAAFTLPVDELLNVSRGADDTDLSALDEAATRLAHAENAAVFTGWDALGITGVQQASPLPPIQHDASPSGWVNAVAEGVAALRAAGVGGPYSLAVGPAEWVHVIESSEHGGYPLAEHIHSVLGGGIEWAPGIDSAVILSLRGGDYVFESGQDISLGYAASSATEVNLYLEETFSFHVATPEAAVTLSAF